MKRPPALLRVYHEHGFTLVEMLVSIFAGLIVTFATFAIVDISLRQTSRIADRVSADQRGRLALEKIMLVLHSSCVAPNVTPVEKESGQNQLRIVSQAGAEASFAQVELHVISYVEEGKGKGKLTDTRYLNTTNKPAPDWEFSEIPSKTQTLLTNISPSVDSKGKEVPIFQYYEYEGSELSPNAVTKLPLTKEDADKIAAINVGFTVAPESGNIGKVANDRTVDLTNTAVLRFSPALTSGTNAPCL